MAFSRQHYIAVAKILRKQIGFVRHSKEAALAVSAITMDLADMFAKDNARFDAAKFFAAADPDYVDNSPE